MVANVHRIVPKNVLNIFIAIDFAKNLLKCFFFNTLNCEFKRLSTIFWTLFPPVK